MITIKTKRNWSSRYVRNDEELLKKSENLSHKTLMSLSHTHIQVGMPLQGLELNQRRPVVPGG